MMVVGIKYCGGCRCVYDRAAAVDKIKAAAGSCRFAYVKPNIEYDAVLVISGCTTQCADLSGIQSRYGFIHVTSGNGWEKAAEHLSEWNIAGGCA